MKKILIIDGQGGGLGKQLVEELRRQKLDAEITAVGTNSAATSAMMKAGADNGATGENPVIVCSGNADIIAGPIGIVLKDALLGEITGKMACAVSDSRAHKVLIPNNRCNHTIVGVAPAPVGELVRQAAVKIAQYCGIDSERCV